MNRSLQYISAFRVLINRTLEMKALSPKTCHSRGGRGGEVYWIWTSGWRLWMFELSIGMRWTDHEVFARVRPAHDLRFAGSNTPCGCLHVAGTCMYVQDVQDVQGVSGSNIGYCLPTTHVHVCMYTVPSFQRTANAKTGALKHFQFRKTFPERVGSPKYVHICKCQVEVDSGFDVLLLNAKTPPRITLRKPEGLAGACTRVDRFPGCLY